MIPTASLWVHSSHRNQILGGHIYRVWHTLQTPWQCFRALCYSSDQVVAQHARFLRCYCAVWSNDTCPTELLRPSDIVTVPSGSSDSLLPTRATAMCIKNSCPLFSSGEQTFGTSPFHWHLRRNPKRPPAWASSSPTKGQRTVVPFCRHRDTSVWGEVGEVGGLQSFFALWCRDNYILFNRLPDPLGQH